MKTVHNFIRPIFRKRLALSVSATALLLGIQARPVHTQLPVTACSATAYLNDPDPKGTNVRFAASARSKMIATITDSDSQLEITGSSNDWLRVRQIRSADGKAMLAREGWVFAKLTAVRARGAAVLRGSPEVTGAVVDKLQDDELLTVLGCRGEWLKVKHGAKTGWIAKNARCGNPVTTCV